MKVLQIKYLQINIAICSDGKFGVQTLVIRLKTSDSGLTPQVPDLDVFRLKALKLSQLYN